MAKKWTRKEWGNLLMIVGLLMLLTVYVGVIPASMVSFETPIASVKADGISERSAVGLFVGFGLIITGAILRFKK